MTHAQGKPVRCFSSAAAAMMGPAGYFTSPAFYNARWSAAGEQREEKFQLFVSRFLRRLDGMNMPFYPQVGQMALREARHRYVTGVDPWRPVESPYLDGTAVTFAHCILSDMPRRCWLLFAEVGFDVARCAQVPVLWGGFAQPEMLGTFRLYGDALPAGWRVDKRTYGVRRGAELDFPL